MEEEKAAAYYDELTRKGSGAARFKQGLGFSASSSTADDPPSRGLALPSSTSSFLRNFVRASSPSKTNELEKQAQLQTIQNKLKKKEPLPSSAIDDSSSSDKTRVRDRGRDRESPRRRSRSREKSRNSRRSRSRSRDRGRHSRRSRSRSRERRRRRSRSRPRSRERKRDRDRDRDRDRERRRRSGSRSRSLSPRDRRSERERDDRSRERKMVRKEGDGPVDYAKLIDGYDKMTPAERVKAKMKLQLSRTAEKDEKIGAGSGWERFEFDKDAPVDDEEIEAADDDAAVVKHLNQTFRFSSLESKKEGAIQAAHDEAMFGAPTAPAESTSSESEEASENENESHDDYMDPANNLINDKVLAKQQGSWRDRARRNVG